MQSKTLIGNQWQLDQGTKAAHVSQSATIQHDREISIGHMLHSLVMHAQVHGLHILYSQEYLRHTCV